MDKMDRYFSQMVNHMIKDSKSTTRNFVMVSLSERTIQKILTKSRMEIIRIIGERNPKSVNELSRIAKRPIESVSRDLRILSNYGLLSFVCTGKTKMPKIDKEFLMIPLKVKAKE
jgi:predicted transcriptional regulator